MPADTVKVDRTTKWGNPFAVGVHGTREHCVKLYIAIMSGMLCISVDAECVDRQRECIAHAKRNLWRLRGKNLACWCSLPKPGVIDSCHAAVLLEIANG